MKNQIFFTTCLSALMLSAAGNVAIAQLNNKPFSFNTPNGSVGMSTAGKQAIINSEIFNVTPDNLVRGSNGTLLSVTKGKGGSAIVSYDGSTIIPSFRGSSFRGANESWSVGVFNTFFEPNYNDSFVPNYTSMATGSVISTWTGRVASNMPVSFSPSSSVDTWTGMVMQIPN